MNSSLEPDRLVDTINSKLINNIDTIAKQVEVEVAKKIIKIKVNGEPYELAVDTWRTLLEVLREDLYLTGTKQGCSQGECGACTVLVDGAAVNACLYLAAEAHQREIETVEGLAPDGAGLHPIQEAFIESGAAECGTCAPGLMMSAKHFLSRNPSLDEAGIKAAFSGHQCRCGNMDKAMKAVKLAAPSLVQGRGKGD